MLPENLPPKYILTEVKMNTKGNPNWKPKVDMKITSCGGSQMTDVWIRANLESEYSISKALSIYKDYQGILIGVLQKNEMIIETLNKSAIVVKNIIKIGQ
ncbi:hypothetical protein [Myroides odoratus]|uniref:hypothetical protein n=1 Tax=Myroides odoratus TaxID=256 RepID=UPI0039B0DA57